MISLYSKLFIRLLIVILFISCSWFVFKSPLPGFAAPLVSAELIQVILTSAWSPASPDPMGIGYNSTTNTFTVVDSEVDEMPNLFAGKNVYHSDLGGNLLQTGLTTSFAKEPSDVAINSANGHYFIADDGKQKVFEIDAGVDGIIGTTDDTQTSFSTNDFGNPDPEALSFYNGNLFVGDSKNKKVFLISPGANGVFDGVTSGDDQIVLSFGTQAAGYTVPEGIAYNDDAGTVFVVSRNKPTRVGELTTSGTLVREIDIAALNLEAPSGLVYAPTSTNSNTKSLYITDRGVDNNDDPNENDGKIFEIQISSGSGTPTPTATPIVSPTPTITPTPSPTPSITPSPSPSPSVVNLIVNPGFEEDSNGDSTPDAWAADTLFSRSSDVFESGSFSGKFFATNNSDGNTRQVIQNILPGTSYTIGGSVLIQPTSDTFKFKVLVRWKNSNNDVLRVDTVKTYTSHTNGSWDTFQQVYQSPAGAANAVIVLDANNLNATVYVDSLVLSQN